MKRRMRLEAVAIVVVALGVLVGCGHKTVVGVLLPTTGEARFYGESIESGIRLAVNDARDRGALPRGFDVVWADTGSDPTRAVEELRTMTRERGVHLVIGAATSSEAEAIIPLLDDLDVVCLSPSASAPDLSGRSKLFFRIYPSDVLEGHTAATFLFERVKRKQVILFAGASQYTEGIEPEFRKQYVDSLGGEVVQRIDLGDEGWKAQARQALKADPSAGVYIIGYAEQILDVLRVVRSANYDGPVVTTSAFYTSQVIDEAGDLAEGVLFPLPPFDRTSQKEPVLSFVNRYMDTYQRAPDVFAAHGYDAMELAIRVMEIAKPPNTIDIKRALQFGITDYMGVTGPIQFDESGDVKHYPAMFIVKDGQVLSFQRYLDIEHARILRKVQDLLNNSAPKPTPQG